MKKYFALAAIAALSFSFTACQNDELIDVPSFVTADETTVILDPKGGEAIMDLDWSDMYLEVCKADIPSWLEVELINAPAKAGRDSDTGTCQVLFRAKENSATITKTARVRVGTMALNREGHAPSQYYVLFEVAQGPVPYIKEDVGPSITEDGTKIIFNYISASYQVACESYSIEDEDDLFHVAETPAGISIVRKSTKSGKATLIADDKTYDLIAR